VAPGNDEVRDEIRAGHAAAAARWPGIRLGPDEFAAFVGERVADGDPAPTADGLAQLYLVGGLVRGDAAAMRHFEAACFPAVDRALARMRLSAADRDDVKQLVRQKLFVPTSGAPRIEGFTGRGDLVGWLKAVAVRVGLNYLRDHKRETPSEELEPWEELDGVATDPELLHFREHYRERFAAAFARAVAALGDRERTLLRYHYVDGLALAQIAAIYQVHRSTAFRWLDDARATIVKLTRDALCAEIQVSTRGMASIVRLIESQLDVVVARSFGEAGPR
jgi:RNA polymerase sigma-70 factor (ECF subfamily)